MKKLNKLKPYFMLFPAITFFMLFFIYPLVYMIRLSFTSWNLISPNKEFVAFDNYIKLCSSNEFIHTILNTLEYTGLTVSLAIILALFLALWLNKEGTLYSLTQGAIFSPYIISLVSVSLIWLWMMDPQYGLLNGLLEVLRLPKSLWLTHPDTALFSLVIVGVWKVLGYNTLILMAGLQRIPKEIYEAAELDEATSFRKFYKITLPMLSPSIFFLLIVSTISSFQVFDTVQVMTQGGPINSTNMLVYYIYENAFGFFKIGYASAAGVVLLVIVGIMTIFHFGVLSKRVHYK